MFKVVSKEEKKIPIIALSSEELERLKGKKYKEKEITIEDYVKGKEEEAEEKN